MADNRDYDRHEWLVAPARARPQIWRFLIGVGLITGMIFGLNATAYAVIFAIAPDFWVSELAPANGQGNSPASMLLLLFGFVFMIIATGAAAKLLQNRSLPGLIGPLSLALRQFWQVLRLLLVLGALVLMLPPYDVGAPLAYNLEPGLWLALLPLSLIAVLIQSGAEEILFRGYIQQSLAARFANPLVWMVLPAALFALGHYLPAEAGDNAMLIALWAGIFAMLMADLTARAGTLGPAIAVHFFNNVTSLLLVSLPGSLTGLALYTAPFAMSDTGMLRQWLMVDLAIMVIGWLAARVAVRR